MRPTWRNYRTGTVWGFRSGLESNSIFTPAVRTPVRAGPGTGLRTSTLLKTFAWWTPKSEKIHVRPTANGMTSSLHSPDKRFGSMLVIIELVSHHHTVAAAPIRQPAMYYVIFACVCLCDLHPTRVQWCPRTHITHHGHHPYSGSSYCDCLLPSAAAASISLSCFWPSSVVASIICSSKLRMLACQPLC